VFPDRPRRWLPVTVLLLLAVSVPVAAPASGQPFYLIPAAGAPSSPSDEASSLARQEFRLLAVDDEPACWPCRLERITLGDESGGVPSDEPSVRSTPPWRQRLFAGLVAAAVPTATAINSTVGYTRQDFHFIDDGFFGAGTPEGGADKASHFVDYYITAKEISFVFGKLGYSESEARWMGLGVAIMGGVVNELFDGFTRHGFSYGDLVMDVLGAGTATLVSMARADDLVGFRTSHLPGPTYTHDVYSMDLKLASLARRLGLNVGPLRYLFFSVTYGAKGYPNGFPEDQQRQVGLEIGLNLEEMLNGVSIRRDTWWGYGLHLVVDNMRFPYTAVGMRYDLNHRKWHGPNTGNYP
jgi:hypothetical protein